MNKKRFNLKLTALIIVSALNIYCIGNNNGSNQSMSFAQNKYTNEIEKPGKDSVRLISNKQFTATEGGFLFPSFAIVHKGYLVLDDCFGYELEGEPYRPRHGMAMCDIDIESIPPVYRNLINKTFTVSGGNAFTTEVELLSYHVLIDYTPHFGELQEWGNSELTDDEIASKIFDDGKGARLLVATVNRKLDYEYNWAQLEALSNNNVQKASGEFVSIVQESIYTSSEFKSIQQGYENYIKDDPDNYPGSWENYARADWRDYSTSKINIAFYHGASKESYHSDNFEAILSKVFIAPAKENISAGDVFEISNNYGIPEDAFDIDNDGYPEFLFVDGQLGYHFVKYVEGDLTTIWSIEIPFYDCPY